MAKLFGLRRAVRPLVNRFFSPSKTGRLWFVFANLILSFGSSNTRVSWDETAQLYRFSSPTSKIYVARPSRLWAYVDGVEARLNRLALGYWVDHVGSLRNEIVVDVGANIGEFSMFCEALGAQVHAFEPDPIEFQALALNLSANSVPHNVGLWSEAGKQTLWLANESGDSTLIDAGKSNDSIEVSVTTLDAWADEHLSPNEEIGLLKLEAEGAEPEILRGFGKNLHRCKFVVVDAGFERGVTQSATLPEVSNYLISHGFEMVALAKSRLTVLFKRV